MEYIALNPIYEFTPETLHDIRRKYDLNGPGRMDDAVNSLEEWIKKQRHFNKKDFSREYLERCIINSKGSVEAAKKNLDSLCTLRYVIPHLYGDFDFKNDFQHVFKIVSTVMLPKCAPDYQRMFLLKCTIQEVNKEAFRDCYKFILSLADYWKTYDYSNGVIVILDYRDINIADFMTSIDLMDLKSSISMIMEGYKVRIKGVHILSASTTIQIVVTLLKKVFSSKIQDRFHIHTTLEELFEFVPKDLMPVEYGGSERSIKELQDLWIDVLSSKEHREHMKDMNQAVTVENKLKEEINEDSFGTSGTFRSLNVD